MASYSGSLRAAPYAPPRRFRPRMPITILDGYIFREMIGPFGFALAVFFTFWFFNIFFLAADYIINAHAPIFLLLRFLAFRVPQSIPMAFPFGSLLATLLAFGRLAGDNELTALRTSGIRFSRICVAPLLFGLAMFGLCYYINEKVTPIAVEMSTRTFYQIVYHTAEIPVVPKFFRKDDSTGTVFYVDNVEPDHRTMDDVMIFKNATTTPFRTVITAQRAIVDGANLHLVDARFTAFKPSGEVDGGSTQIRTLDVPLPLNETVDQFINTTNSDPTTVDSKTLTANIKTMQMTGEGGQALALLKVTLAEKLAYPFASFIAVLISLPLAAAFGKKGRVLGVAMSIVLYFVYYLMTAAFTALGKNDAVDPYLAAWIPNMVMGTVGIALFLRVER